uniref:Uncharacterized protein MANES_06G119900 n=1 Tax=Rhizophora mucronata TaxID=61149 RepID=A0A2P2JTN1_RHIMU
MKVPGRKLILLLFFILSCMSILRLLRIAITTLSSTPPLPSLHTTPQQTCSPACNNTPSHALNSPRIPHKLSANNLITKKEFKFLSNVVKNKAPCNLLIFGMETPYLKLSSINSGGITIFLEDDLEKISSIRVKPNNTRIYKVEHQIPAKKAYELLKHARRSTHCAANSGRLQNSTCKLAMKNLPQAIYELQWDVVVVDGPSGHSAEAPGRMATIYTASMIARAGNSTDVMVHDVDRTIEKWFSWEFLCDENLVSSKGKLWNFRITGRSNSTRFCSDNGV